MLREMGNIMYHFAGFVCKVFFSMFGRVKVYGREHLPESGGGFIIACTHTGWVDIIWLGIAILPRQIHYMAKVELFQNPFTRWLIKKLNAFPVNRENPGPSSIKIPRKLLKENKIVGIFPSGTRTTEEVPLKRGAVTIASHANAPIVPAAYVGPNNFSDLLKFKRPHLIFGPPIHLDETKPKREAMDEMMEQLNEALKRLQDTLIKETQK